MKEFSSRSPICLSLHLTSEKFSGWLYSLIIFGQIPLLCHSILCFSYLKIVSEIKSTKGKLKDSKAKSSTTVIYVLFIMFLINTLSIMPVWLISRFFSSFFSSNIHQFFFVGIFVSIKIVDFSNEIFLFILAFIIPLNSIFNPFIYSLNSIFYSIQKYKEKHQMFNFHLYF